MEKNKRDLLLALGLVLVLVFLLAKNFIFTHKSPIKTAEPQGAGALLPGNAISLGAILLNQKLFTEQEASASQGWVRDPFSLEPAGALQGFSNFTLSGIVWDPKLPVAILNGNMYKPGDKIQDYTVAIITQDTVTVTRGEEKVKLQLFESTSS